MTVTADALRTLHRIHHQLADLRDRIDRGPKQIQAHEHAVSRLEAAAEKAREELRKTQVAVDSRQLQLRTSEARIVDLKSKLNSCGSNREYQALLTQIEADKMTNSVLEDEILEGMDKVERYQARLKEAEKNLAKGKEDLDKTRQTVETQKGSLAEDRGRLEADLKTAETELPGDIRDIYMRVVHARGENAMAKVVDDCCGGCYHQVTPNMMNELMLSRIVFCSSCGCLLYLPETVLPGAENQNDDF